MINPRLQLALLWLCLLASLPMKAAEEVRPTLEIEAKTDAYYYETNNLAMITNGVTIKYTDASGLALLTADSASVNQSTGDIFARGNVRLQKDGETWTGDQLHYNYQTKLMDTAAFRMGRAPFYIRGEGLRGAGEGSNAVYTGTNAYVTTDDYYEPLQKIRAKQFLIVPGRYVEAHNATLCAGNVPIFFFPYYKHNLNDNQNQFSFLPGYRSLYGPYLLSTYNWFINDQIRGEVHADYREKRGVGGGPDVKYDFGNLGEGTARYYYTHDQAPNSDPVTGAPITPNRQRAYFNYNATPATNLSILSQVAYQSDAYVVRDFFESQYQKDIQPNTFVEVNQFWQNWSVDALTQPRINPFWDSVERLPDVRLSGYRQEIGNTPFYYESQSSIGYFRRRFADTNQFNPVPSAIPLEYSAMRADTFHQITMPETFFGWLNFTPRAGGRVTYYDSASGPGATTTNQTRYVFNTGAELSFTAYQTWAGERNSFWDVDGLRHIFQPSINYVYIPRPNEQPNSLPQFDFQFTNALRLQPIDFPDNNGIDSINAENTLRYGINNRIQTKRDGELDDLINSSIYIDWNLRPRTDQSTFSDIYSDLTLKPRRWLSLNSFVRYSISQGNFNLAQHTVTLQPSTTWNWTVGHIFLRSGEIFGTGDNLLTSIFFYRLNENWGTRLAHYFDAKTGTMQEQDYTIYRDLRSWTAALTFRALKSQGYPVDYGVAFSFSFKSFPRFGLGQDTVRAGSLLGY